MSDEVDYEASDSDSEGPLPAPVKAPSLNNDKGSPARGQENAKREDGGGQDGDGDKYVKDDSKATTVLVSGDASAITAANKMEKELVNFSTITAAAEDDRATIKKTTTSNAASASTSDGDETLPMLRNRRGYSDEHAHDDGSCRPRHSHEDHVSSESTDREGNEGGRTLDRNNTATINSADPPASQASMTVRGYNTSAPPASGAGANAAAMQYKRKQVLDASVYIPPAKRRLMLEQQKNEEELKKRTNDGGEEGEENEEGDVNGGDRKVKPSLTDKNRYPATDTGSSVSSLQVQRASWEALRKTIHGTINRLNETTIKPLIAKLFADANLIRGRGLLARSILKASITSPSYAPVYAALVAVINTKLPEVGELLVSRAISTLKRLYKRKDQRGTLATVTLLGHLMNQSVVHEYLALQMLMVFLEERTVTDASVEVALELTEVVGQLLIDVSPSGLKAVMERYRSILHEGTASKRVQYKIEDVFAARKSNFSSHPKVIPALDLVEEDDQITFEMGLDKDDNTNKDNVMSTDRSSMKNKQETLDVFRFDEHYDENERMWAKIRMEVLGDDSGEEGGDGDSETGSSGSDEEEEEEQEENQQQLALVEDNKKTTAVHDLSEQDLVNLRRTIYLTIMSSASFEECAHKLAKMTIPEGRESELVNMLIECCSQERTFLRYYGLIAQRFCLMDTRWAQSFEDSFREQYQTIHRLETNKLRNVAKLFAHMFHTDALPWSALEVIHLNEDETTSSSRIFLKIMVQEMAEALGMAQLQKRFNDSDMQDVFGGMFPRDNPRNTRYAINFFTSIGLGPLTDELREHLANAPKLILAQARAEAEAQAKKLVEAQAEEDDNSSTSVSSSSSSSSDSSSSSNTSSSSASSRSTTSSSQTSRSDSSTGSSRSTNSREQGRTGSRRSSIGKMRSSNSSRSSSTDVSQSRSRSRSRSSSDSSCDSRRGSARDQIKRRSSDTYHSSSRDRKYNSNRSRTRKRRSSSSASHSSYSPIDSDNRRKSATKHNAPLKQIDIQTTKINGSQAKDRSPKDSSHHDRAPSNSKNNSEPSNKTGSGSNRRCNSADQKQNKRGPSSSSSNSSRSRPYERRNRSAARVRSSSSVKESGRGRRDNKRSPRNDCSRPSPRSEKDTDEDGDRDGRNMLRREMEDGNKSRGRN
jgi:pre-mRNA-splicing factor CWC22